MEFLSGRRPNVRTVEETPTYPEEPVMWDTIRSDDHPLSHDLPCQRCGHAMHTYLACDAGCECVPVSPPGAAQRARVA